MEKDQLENRFENTPISDLVYELGQAIKEECLAVYEELRPEIQVHIINTADKTNSKPTELFKFAGNLYPETKSYRYHGDYYNRIYFDDHPVVHDIDETIYYREFHRNIARKLLLINSIFATILAVWAPFLQQTPPEVEKIFLIIMLLQALSTLPANIYTYYKSVFTYNPKKLPEYQNSRFSNELQELKDRLLEFHKLTLILEEKKHLATEKERNKLRHQAHQILQKAKETNALILEVGNIELSYQLEEDTQEQFTIPEEVTKTVEQK